MCLGGHSCIVKAPQIQNPRLGGYDDQGILTTVGSSLMLPRCQARFRIVSRILVDISPPLQESVGLKRCGKFRYPVVFMSPTKPMTLTMKYNL